MLEMKLTLAKILRNFDILAPENGLAELVIKEGALRRPKYGIHVVLRKRQV